jgi:tetratricopeptide (TPR) repeat protein
MMTLRLTCFIFFISIFCFTANGQLNQLDSLYKELEQSTGLERVDLQLGVASRIVVSNRNKADSLVRIALKSAQELDNVDREVSAKIILAGMFDRSKADSAELLFQDAIELSKLDVSNKAKTGARLNYGSFLIQQNRYAEAVEQHTVGAEVASREENLLVYELAHLMNLGIIMQTLEDYDQSEKYFLEALEKTDKPNLEFRKAQTLGNLGILEFKKNNFGRSTTYHKESFSIFEKGNAKSPMAISLINLGLSETRLGHYREAKEYLLRALELKEELNDERGRALVVKYMGELEMDQRNFDYARELLQQAEVIFRQYNDHLNLIDIHKKLSEIYEIRGDFEKALEQFKYTEAFQDSIKLKNKETDINKALASFEIERLKKENELNLKLAEVKVQQRNQTIYGAIALLAISVSLLLWNRNRLKNKLRIEQLKSQLSAQESLLKSKEFETEKDKLEAYAQKLLNSNESLQEKKEELESQLSDSSQKEDEIKQLIERLKDSINNENDWTAFRLYFDRAYPAFFGKLNDGISAELTFNEKRLVSMMKIQLTNKEIAIALNIQRDSVVKAKIRLKEKLGFAEMKQMEEFIVSIE